MRGLWVIMSTIFISLLLGMMAKLNFQNFSPKKEKKMFIEVSSACNPTEFGNEQ